MASILHLGLVEKKLKRMGLIYMTKLLLQKRHGSGETPEDLRHLPRGVKAAMSSGFQNA